MERREEMARRMAEERQAIRMRLREMKGGALNGGSGGHHSTDGPGRDVFEQAQQEFLRDQEVRTYELLAARARALDWAWESLRRGTYGICQRCGGLIPQKRLEAVPGAAFCIACQEQLERAA
jgi:DnaK suppressor protein